MVDKPMLGVPGGDEKKLRMELKEHVVFQGAIFQN
jgi:hypothetical protein